MNSVMNIKRIRLIAYFNITFLRFREVNISSESFVIIMHKYRASFCSPGIRYYIW